MSLFDQIKADQLSARKAKDALASSLLTTLIGEVSAIAKNDGNREVTDADVVKTCKKFVAGMEQTVQYCKGTNQEGMDTALAEMEIIERYLPVQLTELELQKIVGNLAQALPERNPKQMGVLMKQLKEAYDGQYDGALASKVIKAVLSV